MIALVGVLILILFWFWFEHFSPGGLGEREAAGVVTAEDRPAEIVAAESQNIIKKSSSFVADSGATGLNPQR